MLEAELDGHLDNEKHEKVLMATTIIGLEKENKCHLKQRQNQSCQRPGWHL